MRAGAASFRDVSREFQENLGGSRRQQGLSSDCPEHPGRAAAGPSTSRTAGQLGPAPRRPAGRRQPRPVHRQSDENAQERQDRSGAGARFRNPPGGRHPHAAAAEQSHPHRRGGRRQNRRRRRLRAAHRQRRRAAAAEKCDASARSTWRCCRRARESRANSRIG